MKKKMETNDTIKVLVVEDSKVTMKVLCNYLGRMNITPLTAETGSDALDIYHREQPDIILLDAQLPDIDGFDVALKIRALEKAKAAGWTPEALKKLQDAIVKTFSENVLVDIVDQFYRIAPMVAEFYAAREAYYDLHGREEKDEPTAKPE